MTKKKNVLRVKRSVQGVMIDITCSTQKEAETLNTMIDDLQTGRLGSNQHEIKVSLARAWCGVLDDKKEEGLDVGTIKSVMKPLRIVGALLQRDVMEIKPEEFINAFSNATNCHNGKPLAMRTLENYAITLREVLEKAVELGAKGLPVKKIDREIMKIAKANGVPEKDYTSYSIEERDRWLNSEETLAQWVRLYVRAALASFKRQGELMALGWPDVDFKARKILINKQVSDGRFKWGLKAGGAAHYIEMDDELYEVFMALKKWQEDAGIKSDWVFASPLKTQWKSFPANQKCPYKGKPVSRMLIKIRVQEDMLRAGIPTKKMHDLRRTAATLYFLTSDADFKTVMIILQKKLNHASILVTEEYISASSEYIQEMAQKIKENKTVKASNVSDLEVRIKELELEKRILELELITKKMREELQKAA